MKPNLGKLVCVGAILIPVATIIALISTGAIDESSRKQRALEDKIYTDPFKNTRWICDSADITFRADNTFDVFNFNPKSKRPYSITGNYRIDPIDMVRLTFERRGYANVW